MKLYRDTFFCVRQDNSVKKVGATEQMFQIRFTGKFFFSKAATSALG